MVEDNIVSVVYNAITEAEKRAQERIRDAKKHIEAEKLKLLSEFRRKKTEITSSTYKKSEDILREYISEANRIAEVIKANNRRKIEELTAKAELKIDAAAKIALKEVLGWEL